MSKIKLLTCIDCLHVSTDKYPVIMQKCPFASEIHGDDTLLPLCDSCARQRAMDI